MEKDKNQSSFIFLFLLTKIRQVVHFYYVFGELKNVKSSYNYECKQKLYLHSFQSIFLTEKENVITSLREKIINNVKKSKFQCGISVQCL